jgi:hypothetical protein
VVCVAGLRCFVYSMFVVLASVQRFSMPINEKFSEQLMHMCKCVWLDFVVCDLLTILVS